MKNLPRHVAIIMDGNGRWARQRALPKISGHREGVKAVHRIVKAAVELNIEVLTLYAFSVENWNRSPKEVNNLMNMLPEFLEKETPELKKNNICFKTIGQMQGLPKFVQQALQRTIQETANNTGLKLVLALNYGGRTELVDAVRAISEDVRIGQLSSDQINENIVSRYLYTAQLPDPDLLIRTSGEMRVSNFLLWQISYAEIYVTKKLWPDFKREDFLKAIQDYQQRERRFGGDPFLAQLKN